MISTEIYGRSVKSKKVNKSEGCPVLPGVIFFGWKGNNNKISLSVLLNRFKCEKFFQQNLHRRPSPIISPHPSAQLSCAISTKPARWAAV